VIGRHPVFEPGWKEKLLAVVGSDWLCHRLFDASHLMWVAEF
jgi:hypothetical protein